MAQAFNIEKVGRAKGINGQVTFWSWGANSYGQLSQGHCEDQLLPRQVKNVIGQDVERVTGGGGHTFVLTRAGGLQACGSNNKGQLGLGHLTDVSELTDIPHFKSTRITRVAAGWDFSLVVTDKGHLFVFGSNSFGQLGDPSLPRKCSTPSRVEFPNQEHVIQVAAGLRHSVALTENGLVYCWGHAKKGQCGCNDGEIQGLKIATPTKVPLPEIRGRVMDIVAGSYHTAALTEDHGKSDQHHGKIMEISWNFVEEDAGEVLVWGCNKYGQTTQNPDFVLHINTPYIVPTEMFQGQKVKVIKSGWTHLIAQTGNLYSWGRADYGQLGRTLYPEVPSSPTPGLIDTTEKILDFCCGSEHALFLSENQKCYAVGWNEHGLCGTGDEENVSGLRLVEVLKDYSVISIGCGGGHCFAITETVPLTGDSY